MTRAVNKPYKHERDLFTFVRLTLNRQKKKKKITKTSMNGFSRSYSFMFVRLNTKKHKLTLMNKHT